MPDLPGKPSPYTFVPVVADKIKTHPVVFHDGKNSADLFTGELCCEIECLTPTLIGHFQHSLNDRNDIQKSAGKIDLSKQEWGNITGGNDKYDEGKGFLQPLFLGSNPETSPILISGSSLKGMVRHNIGAMFSAPMERVQEQYFSYRPNLGWNSNPNKYFCKAAYIENINPDGSINIQLFKTDNLRSTVIFKEFRKRRHVNYDEYIYKGGTDTGVRLNKTKNGTTVVYEKAWVASNIQTTKANIPNKIVRQYHRTQDELANESYGHLHRRKDITNKQEKKDSAKAILDTKNLENNQLIYVEVDENNNVVSFGHNFRYRWRYADSIRETQDGATGNRNQKRPELSSPDDETVDGTDNSQLTATRLLFGYVDGSEDATDNLNLGIGSDTYERLAGRISINTAVEQFGDKSLDERFLQRNNADTDTHHRYTLPLKILGEPQASAVEHYLQQKDKCLKTYGDLPGVEPSGTPLNGRKFYRHQKNIQQSNFTETNPEKLKSKQCSFAQFISKEGTKFRFTLRFKDLCEWELAAIMLALSPQLEKPSTANKMGYAKPLGLGSIRINIDEISMLNTATGELEPKDDFDCKSFIQKQLTQNEELKPAALDSWLNVLEYEDSIKADYPRIDGEIYSYHTGIRFEYSKKRRSGKAMSNNYGKPVQ